jgi:hypothetical protein
LRDAGSDATEGEGQTMTWSKAYDAMQKQRFIRRASWEENAVMLLYIDDEGLEEYFYVTELAKQYFDKQASGGYIFKKDQHPSDDWEIYPYQYNFDNHSWYYVGTL